MSKDVEIVRDGDNRDNRQLALPERGQLPATELSAKDIRARLDKIVEVQRDAMKEGVDFGTIPGTEGPKGEKRPTLLKPGAEKLCVLFRLDAQFQGPGNEDIEHQDGHLTCKRYCTLYSQVSGDRLGGASSRCSSRESKYRWRNSNRECPNCGKETILRSKFPDRETGDVGWYCFAKKGGCGANFESTNKAITGQTVGRKENEDIADQFNTVVRIAEKRALIAAVRLVTGASAIFDEEMPDADDTGAGSGASGATGGAGASQDAGAGADAGKEKKGRKKAPNAKSENGAPAGDAVGTAELKVLEGLFEQVKFDSEENKTWYRTTICKQFNIPGPAFDGIKKAQFDLACTILKKKLAAQSPAGAEA